MHKSLIYLPDHRSHRCETANVNIYSADEEIFRRLLMMSMIFYSPPHVYCLMMWRNAANKIKTGLFVECRSDSLPIQSRCYSLPMKNCEEKHEKEITREHLTERTERFCFAFTIKSQRRRQQQQKDKENKSLKWCIQIMGRKVETTAEAEDKKKKTFLPETRSLSCREEISLRVLRRVLFLKCCRRNEKYVDVCMRVKSIRIICHKKCIARFISDEISLFSLPREKSFKTKGNRYTWCVLQGAASEIMSF